MRWHFHLTPPSDGVSNMALDEALMRRAGRTQDAVFRVYGWSAPTLSLGRNQRARGCYDEGRARELGIAFVRRPTGGRALMHHREITYSVTMPVADAADARDAYDFINDILLDGLARLGVAASRATATEAMPPGLRPCFDAPAEHEVVIGSRKLVGSAQWRRDGALLQHGSILVHDDQSVIAGLLTNPATETTGAATLAGALGREPATDEVADVLLGAVRNSTGQSVTPLTPDRELDRDIAELGRVYGDDAWTWRR
jgi:lipoate-protein ligase A